MFPRVFLGEIVLFFVVFFVVDLDIGNEIGLLIFCSLELLIFSGVALALVALVSFNFPLFEGDVEYFSDGLAFVTLSLDLAFGLLAFVTDTFDTFLVFSIEARVLFFLFAAFEAIFGFTVLFLLTGPLLLILTFLPCLVTFVFTLSTFLAAFWGILPTFFLFTTILGWLTFTYLHKTESHF